VQGRYSNACFVPGHDPCTMAVSDPSDPEQFIHLEQSLAFRQDGDCLLAALRASLTYRFYLPILFRNR
jgi:hypothetical protein